MNAAGIYAIENKVNGKVYVGSAVDLGHHSLKLQRAWDKHGAASFAFAPLPFPDEHRRKLSIAARNRKARGMRGSDDRDGRGVMKLSSTIKRTPS